MSQVITIRLSGDELEKLDKIAHEFRHRSEGYYIASRSKAIKVLIKDFSLENYDEKLARSRQM